MLEQNVDGRNSGRDSFGENKEIVDQMVLQYEKADPEKRATILSSLKAEEEKITASGSSGFKIPVRLAVVQEAIREINKLES